jgi:hypothetical protein
VNLDFAPVFDVVPPGTDASNQPIGVLEREYGHDPGTVGSHAAAFVAGMAEAGVATTAKHFPGLGRVVGNTDIALEAGSLPTAGYVLVRGSGHVPEASGPRCFWRPQTDFGERQGGLQASVPVRQPSDGLVVVGRPS